MTKPKPRLTADALDKAMVPANNCRVLAFLNALDDESRVVAEKALAMKKEDFPARGVMEFFQAAEFDPDIIPGITAIANHRSGTRPCRCKG